MSQIKRYPEWAAGQFQRRKNSDAKDQKKHFFFGNFTGEITGLPRISCMESFYRWRLLPERKISFINYFSFSVGIPLHTLKILLNISKNGQ